MIFFALKLLAVTAMLPLPSDTPPARRVPPPAARELRAAEDVVLTARMADGSRAPSTITLPELKNRAEVITYIRKNYPDSTVAAPSVIPVTWVYIDELGKPHMPEVLVSSGSSRYDTLAIAAVTRAQFAPARVDSVRVAVWVMLPVQVRGLAAQAPAPCDMDKGPCFTPYTVKPALQNRTDVARALVLNYPPDLKERGVSGTTVVWVRLSDDGRVVDVRVRESSGQPALDEAALRVAQMMIFTPALHRDLPVPVWIALPIVFRTR